MGKFIAGTKHQAEQSCAEANGSADVKRGISDRSAFRREQEKVSRLCKSVERGKRRIQSRQFYDGVSVGSKLYI